MLNFGVTLENQGKRAAALAAFKQAVALNPSLTQASMGIALLHAQAGEHIATIAVLEETVKRDPEWIDLWINLGISYARQGALEQARSALKRALVLDSNHSTAQANMAELDRLTGRR
ncbi:MAG: tetratricopeptide repeat protein [Candidatus Latescibacterota bacterium]|nr:tetratricopeptide repeat protein [Candidatus Latescibacterota bacterium]